MSGTECFALDKILFLSRFPFVLRRRCCPKEASQIRSEKVIPFILNF